MSTDATDNSDQPVEPAPPTPQPYVAPSPHMFDASLTTQGMMRDVIIGLSPALVAAVVIFQWYAVVQVGLCVLSCLAAETIFTKMRRRPVPLADFSAAVTGVILGLSFPATAPWYVAVIGSFVAIGLGKTLFGGLGYNLFNPAMVGRAFVMLSFAREMGASAYRAAEAQVAVITQATPLTVAKKFASDLAAGKAELTQTPDVLQTDGLLPLLLGNVNGSLGETSSLALLIGGIYLCVRRSASWEIPVSCIAAAGGCAALAHAAGLTQMGVLHQLLSGALLFGAFFIATDPVSSPLSPRGKLVFGAGIGVLIVLIRVFSGYPEGVMFAVLLMNAAVPLINRWTIPRPSAVHFLKFRKRVMNEKQKPAGNYITTAWLVITLALIYGAALAGVQMKLGPIIAENKLNETYAQIPQLVDNADQAASRQSNQENPLIVTGSDGKETRVYRAVDADGTLVGWVIPAAGQGFADRIEVLLGTNADVSRITGLFVLDQKETPGLGDYITEKDFRHLFVGMSTDTPLTVVTGSPEAPHEIKALTGATISSESVADIVNRAVANTRGPLLEVKP